MKTFKTIRSSSTLQTHKSSRTLALILFLCFCLPMFSMTAFAKSPPPEAQASDLLEAVAEQTGLPADADALMEAGYLNAASKRQLEKYNCFSSAVAWQVLLPAFGIYPYPAELYPDISPHPDYPNGSVYADARAAGILLSLVDPELNPTYVMSKPDFDTLLLKLKTTQFDLPAPETNNPYISAYEEAIATGETKPWNIHTYLGRNSVLAAYAYIPAGWLADFDARGWHIEFELPPNHPASKLAAYGYSSAGLTNYSIKTIIVANPSARTTVHEFAHFAAKYAQIDTNDMKGCFAREASGTISIIGLYASLSPSEYLAEFASYWLLHPDEQPTLRELAPDTADLTEYLIHALDDSIPIRTKLETTPANVQTITFSNIYLSAAKATKAA